MNIFLYELKSQLKSVFLWTFFLLLFFFAYVFGIYPIFQDSMQNIKQMVSGFPPGFSKAFGFDLLSMFQYSGFYTFLFQYLALLGAIMTAYFTVSIFGEETKSHCQDFLFTKPIKRAHIFFLKLFSVIGLLVISNLFYIISALLLFQKYDTKKHMILASLCLFFTELVFVGCGIFYTVFAKKIRSISGIACAFGFIAFILGAMTRIINETYFYYLSPFSFFDPGVLWKQNHLKISYVIWAVILFFTQIAISFFYYCKKDSKTL